MHPPSRVYLQSISVSTSYPCPASTQLLSGDHVKLPAWSEPSLPPTSTLMTSFHYCSSLSIPLLFIAVPCLSVPILPSFLMPYFSLFYSMVCPSTESSHVQGSAAAGCHHGLEVPIQFASDARGCQHPAPSLPTCRCHRHLQSLICRQPMAQQRR